MLKDLSEKERNDLGATLKDRGNKLYSKKDFRKAVEWYVRSL
jgi:import receptor subunit TOM70